MVEMMNTEQTATSQTITDELLTQLFVESGAVPELTRELRTAINVLAGSIEGAAFTIAAQKIAQDCAPLLELPPDRMLGPLADVPKAHGLWLIERARAAHDNEALAEHGLDRLAHLMVQAVTKGVPE